MAFKPIWYRKIPVNNIIALILLGSLFVFFIWVGTGIQKIVTPRKYWQKQVEKLDQDVELRRLAVKAARRDIPLQMNELPASIEQYYDSLVNLGWDSTEARKETSFLKGTTLKALKAALEIHEEHFFEDSIALDRANRRLQQLVD